MYTHHGVRIDGTHEVAFKFHYICVHYIECIDYGKQLHHQSQFVNNAETKVLSTFWIL